MRSRWPQKYNDLNDMHKKIRQKGLLSPLIVSICLIMNALAVQAQHVYRFDIKEDIGPSAWRQVKNDYAKADEAKVNLVITEMNTLGGVENFADYCRRRNLESTFET